MHIGPNVWPLGPHRASPMSVGRLEFNKYDFVGQDQRFGTQFAHVINLKVPNMLLGPNFWPISGP